jgi:hypothetical protein
LLLNKADIVSAIIVLFILYRRGDPININNGYGIFKKDRRHNSTNIHISSYNFIQLDIITALIYLIPSNVFQIFGQRNNAFYKIVNFIRAL